MPTGQLVVQVFLSIEDGEIVYVSLDREDASQFHAGAIASVPVEAIDAPDCEALPPAGGLDSLLLGVAALLTALF